MECSCDTISPDGSCYWTVWRKARKKHICYECESPIDPGETYQETTGIWEGEFQRFKFCELCAEKWREVFGTELAMCIGFGDLWNYANEIE